MSLEAIRMKKKTSIFFLEINYIILHECKKQLNKTNKVSYIQRKAWFTCERKHSKLSEYSITV